MVSLVLRNQSSNEHHAVTRIGSSDDSLDRREICMLINGVDYFLHHVFILKEKFGWRLVVIHAGQVRTNKCYAELRHAKIAFARMYNRKAWKKGVKAEWTNPYKPDSLWLDKKIKMLKKHTSI